MHLFYICLRSLHLPYSVLTVVPEKRPELHFKPLLRSTSLKSCFSSTTFSLMKQEVASQLFPSSPYYFETQVSISSTFYVRIFRTNDVLAAFF